MQTNAPATGEWVDQFNRAFTFGQVSVSTTGAIPFLTATVDLNYGSITGSGGFADSTNIPVAGAQLNDLVLVNCVSIRGSGDGSRPLVFTAFVSATDAVTVRAINPTALAVNPGNYTFKILVAKGV